MTVPGAITIEAVVVWTVFAFCLGVGWSLGVALVARVLRGRRPV